MFYPLRHLAIIMDGNARWAKIAKVSLKTAYRRGAKRAEDIISFALKNDEIKFLTLFVLSRENCQRPEKEVKILFTLLEEYLSKILKEFDNNLRFLFIGDRSSLPENIEKLMSEVEESSRNGEGLTVIMAINYGAREALRAAIKIAGEDFEKALNPHEIPDPDLLIRTSGETRLSNFLLWELAYSEFYFTGTLWPDFDTKALQEAINQYKKRERRFGKRL